MIALLGEDEPATAGALHIAFAKLIDSSLNVLGQTFNFVVADPHISRAATAAAALGAFEPQSVLVPR